jgi:hypothetical protein
MSTIHLIADPQIRVELATRGQYCGRITSWINRGTKKSGGTKRQKCQVDRRDYFEEYCATVYPDWDTCKELAKKMMDTADDELLAQIEKYYNAEDEPELYDPFEYLANLAFKVARDDLMTVERLGLRDEYLGTGSSTESLPHLVAVPTYNRPVLGCADKRK